MLLFWINNASFSLCPSSSNCLWKYLDRVFFSKGEHWNDLCVVRPFWEGGAQSWVLLHVLTICLPAEMCLCRCLLDVCQESAVEPVTDAGQMNELLLWREREGAANRIQHCGEEVAGAGSQQNRPCPAFSSEAWNLEAGYYPYPLDWGVWSS